MVCGRVAMGGDVILTARHLKPHLLHEDGFVRRAVAEWFSKSWSRDPDVVPLILEAARRHGCIETRSELTALHRLVLDERGLDAALVALQQWADEEAAVHVNRMLAQVPAQLLSGHEARILEAEGVWEETAQRIHRRRRLLAWPAEKLWSELEDLAERSQGRYVGEIDHELSDDLVEGLSRHEEPSTARLRELIGRTEGWLETFAVDLAGARRARELVPTLVDKFHIDTDYLLERVHTALVRIGDRAAVRRIRSSFRSADWNYRNYASGVLADLKSEESEEALLDLLSTEPDGGLRVMLCLGLCEQFSERGLAAVLREIRAGYQPGYASLEAEVLPAAELLGVELPEAAEWRARAEAERAALEERSRDLEANWGALQEEWDGRSGGFDDDLLDNPWDDSFGDPLDARVGGYRRTEPKVGRNAPCPCGSGRKFKKCCGTA